MGIRLYQEPQLRNPIMLCGWPGIGNIGITAIETLRVALKAQEFAEIEPYDFFYPRKVIIDEGLLEDLQFPTSKFYYQRVDTQDLIFFIGEEQPTEGRTIYAVGQKSYQMADLVLDIASKFGCQRIFTSGAAVTQIHHTTRPRVWAVPNADDLIDEIRGYENTILMSEIEGSGSQGFISGLNGLLLGLAKKRDLDAICLMGEIPYYLQEAPWPYPKASKSVIEILTKILNIRIDLTQLDYLAEKIEENVEELLQSLYRTDGIPPQVKEQIESMRHAEQARLGPITEEEQKKIMEHIDELFKGEDRGDKRHI